MKAHHDALVFVRVGRFSGSALSLRDALRAHAHVVDCDLLTLARAPWLILGRLLALREAYRSGAPSLWGKTAAWSRATQQALVRRGLLRSDRPILFSQTLPAFDLPSSVTYAIYADRAAREGVAPHAGRFTPEWLQRETAFLRRAHRIYVMGPSTREALERHYGIPAENVMVVGAGPNMVLGPVIASQECRRLLFVGLDWERKGGPDLLAAFAEAHAALPQLELLIAGSDPPPPLPAGVRVLGSVPRERMDTVYSQADALVVPTHDEPFGIALVEALIKGLPCIGTTIGNQQWIVGAGGLCVEPGDISALATAIRRLVQDYPAMRRAAEARGRTLREIFRWERVAELILEDLFNGQAQASQMR